MDPVALVFIVAQAVLLAVAVAVIIGRGRVLDEVRHQLHDDAAPADELASRVRALDDRATAASFDLDVARRDLAYLIELIGIGIVRLSDDGRIVLANAAAHAFLGRDPGSLRGLSSAAAFLDTRIDAILAGARSTGAASGEVQLRPDGATLVVRARRSPVQGIWLVLEDVSELRRLQRIRAEFIDNLSHELRTPITTVSLLAETLSREADQAADAVPERMRDRIGKIEVETGHLVQMVSELLDLSRIETGAAPLLLDDVDLARLATTSAERLRLFAERQGVTITADVPEGGVRAVRGDAGRLGQVLVNLLHNAVKFSPDGGSVIVRVRTEASGIVTSVIDRGIGIPAAAQARIFERFYKVDRARVRGETGGTGLGLAIARHIVEQHGGRIWVESEEGTGSTFAFAIPIAPE